MTQQSTTFVKSQKSKNKKKIIIGTIATLALACIIFFNINWIVITYYYVFKMDHFNAGDKMYVVNNLVKEKQINNVIICRLIKPLTPKEIDTMQVDDHEKAILRLKADNPKLKPYMISTYDYIVADAKNGDVGTYIDHFVFRTISIDNNYVWQHYYAFKPNLEGIKLNDYARKSKIPEGYVLANDTYYVFPLFVKNSKQ